MVNPVRDRERDRGWGTAEGPGPQLSPSLSPQPRTAPADGFASSDDEAAEEDSGPLHISWLSLSPLCSSKFLGLCSLPGCRFKDVRRNLQKDVGELRNSGIQDIFVLCTRGELSKYRVPNLIDTYQQHGMCVHHHPIPDGNAPDIATCCKILEELRSCLENNRKTVIHCYGGLGRSCLVAACLLLQLSDTLAPQQVIESLRNLRGSGAIQTIKQYNFLHEFRENLAAHLATTDTVPRSASR
ncbi:cyclin-dependent kinase inhibitor 3 isoform X3 [Empidonax traillii]|uniref:cyclin-dependent kinase inhibitor 3 isoform X3 n=1 Tax=Empidonax traillii TaxID=164674 RepID=UPI000FFDA656|nr:cyclin-dependent kinase inhibitor 3 isoform X3 [Empidonax traillii]